MDLLFKITYGLFVVSAKDDGGRDNACIINTLMQQSSEPIKLSITVNKLNCTHDMIVKTKKCAVGILSEQTSFKTVQRFGMQTGHKINKFEGVSTIKSQSGFLLPNDNLVGYFELNVIDMVDVGSHTEFITTIGEKVLLDDVKALTYDYYRENIKPKRVVSDSDAERWFCTVCNYIYDATRGDVKNGIPAGTKFEDLPSDWLCPICKHGKEVFVKL